MSAEGLTPIPPKDESEKKKSPEKKKGSLKYLLAAVATMSAVGVHDHLERQQAQRQIEQTQTREDSLVANAAEHPTALLQFYIEHPENLQENNLSTIASAIRRMQDRGPVLNLFNRMRESGIPAMTDLMTSLEAQAQLSAAEILFLHRYSFNSRNSTTQDALFLNSQQRWLAGIEYLEPVFNVLRSHAELGSLEERAHLALVINRQLFFERARNLPGYSSYHFLEPEEITDALVLEALTHVRETQERYGDQQIINPTVISFYSNELDEGVNRFGGEQVRTRLHELAPTVYEYRGEPGASLESPRLQEMLNHIRHSTTPITVLIAAHGSMRGVYLDAGSQPSDAEHPTLPIEAIENAFIDRYTMHPELRAQAEAHPDTIIFDNCFGGNLEGYVYSRLADRALPVPAMISGSEEGAVGYTTESIYGSDLLEAILRAPHATLRDVVRADMLPRPFTRMNRRYGDFVVRPARNTEETANDDVTVFLGGPRRVTATERNLQLSENEDSSTMQG